MTGLKYPYPRQGGLLNNLLVKNTSETWANPICHYCHRGTPVIRKSFRAHICKLGNYPQNSISVSVDFVDVTGRSHAAHFQNFKVIRTALDLRHGPTVASQRKFTKDSLRRQS